MKIKLSKLFKRLLSFTLVVLLSVPSASLVAYADTSQPETAKVDIPDGVVLNYRDVDAVDTSFADESCSEVAALKGSLPASYSSAANIPNSISVSTVKDYVTSIKDQNPYGTCWAHSAISVAESSYIIEKGLNASTSGINWNEYHLVYNTYHTPSDPLGLFGGDKTINCAGDTDLDAGGNNLTTLVTYANWIGPSANTTFGAADVLNKNVSNPIPFAFTDAAHMENGYLLTMPDMTSGSYQADMDVIKQMIVDYGSVSMSYQAAHYSPYWNSGYQYKNVSAGTNHAVTIVGWNDNISANSFGVTAPGNGAWLVKNSWGTSWGLGGYFWLSYYDQTIGKNAFAFDFTTADNYDNNYQYDGGTNSTYGWGYYDQTVAANAFVADSAEILEAVGFHTLDVNMDYEIRIYKNLTANANPNTGTLVHTQIGSQTYAGFHTVDLSKSISISQGERYAVVITLMKDGYPVYFPTDTTGSWGWLDFYSYAKAGQSYIGSTVNSLQDMNAGNTYYADGDNVRIKAFTNEASLRLNKTSATVGLGVPYTLTVTGTLNALTWSSSNTDIATVDQNGVVTGVDYGTATITVTDGVASATCKVTVVEPWNGLHKADDGNWYYFVNHEVDYTYFGVASNEYGTWYVKNGKLITSINGIAQCGSSKDFYYFRNGRVDESVNGFVKNSYGYWYFVNGKIDFEYVGLVKNAYGLWYVQNGKIDEKYNDVATNEEGTWYVLNGKVDTTKTGIYARGGVYYYFRSGKFDENVNGFVKNSYGYWYFVNGKIDFEYVGFIENAYGLWYVQNGKIDSAKNGICAVDGVYYYFRSGRIDKSVNGFVKNSWGYWYFVDGQINMDYVGLVKNAYGLWYVQNGKIDEKYNDVATNEEGTWYVLNGKVDTTKTGIYARGGVYYYFRKGKFDESVNGFVKNSWGYWYFVNGKIDMDYVGFVENAYGLWYVANGKIDSTKNGICAVNGEYYYFKSGLVNKNVNGFVKNSWGYWYFVNGKIDMDYVGLVKNAYGLWFVQGGKIDYDYVGLAEHDDSLWYVQDGKVDYTFTGTIEFEGRTYYIEKGKVISDIAED